MITLKHVGIYVKDIKMMATFYKNVFELYAICEEEKDEGEFLDFLADKEGSEIKVTKLITESGKQNGFGDMLELIQINKSVSGCIEHKGFTECGMMHIAFGVEDIHTVCERIVCFGGKVIVPPFLRKNRNWVCFAQDPERNWIEVIQNG